MPTYLTFDKQKNMKFGLPQGYTSGWGNAVNSLTALGEISHDLPDIADGVASTFKSEDLSMPSPWAKLISYETILFDDNKTYGNVAKQALNDWRCLITMIALKDYIGIDINLKNGRWEKSINLASDGNMFTRRFYKNILQVYPQNSMFSMDIQPHEWDIFTPIYAKNNTLVIGCLSSSTLVCPPFGYSDEAKIFLSAYPFFHKNTFTDPVPWINEDPNRANIMIQYLDNLSANISALTQTVMTVNVSMCQKVNNLVVAFRNQLMINGLVTAPVTIANNQNNLGSVKELLASISVQLPMPESKVVLKSEKESSSKLYIVGTTMFGVESNRDNANNINIIGNQKLSHLTPTFMSGDRTFGTYQLGADEEICRDSDLLLDNLYLVVSEKSIINQGGDIGIYQKISNKDVMWPINPLLFKYMNAEEIRKSIEISFDGNDTYTVTLNLMLSGGPHVFSKSYNGKNVILKMEEDMPHIGVWPYVRVVYPGVDQKNLWRNYFVMKSSFEASGASLKTVVKCDGEYNQTDVRLDLISTKDIERTFTSYSSIPSYVEVYDKQAGGYNSIYCGCILLTPAELKTISPHNSWTVGVDFGTTSSTAFYRDHAASEKVVFGTEYSNEFDPVSGTTNAKEGERIPSGFFSVVNPSHLLPDSENYFVPKSFLKRMSYPTIYEMLTGNVPLGTDTSLTYGHLPFDYATGRSRASQAGTLIYDNLKWDVDAKVKEATKKYLHQFFMHIVYRAIENGVGNIDWKFSYPTALPRTLISDYKSNTHSILDTLSSSTGVKCSVENDAYYPESIVSAEYFQKQYNISTVICIDIGGGTTDISVWKGGLETENLLQTSVKLASRDIFLPAFWNYIKSDAKVKENFLNRKPLVQAYVDKRGGNLGAGDLPKIESILFEYEEAVKKYVGAIGDFSAKKKFEKIISFGLFSLMFYTMDAVAMVKDRFDEHMLMTICIGGNGAKLLEWLPDNYLHDMQNILAEYLKAEYGLDYNIRIQFDTSRLDALKTEAVRGLLTINQRANVFHNNLMLPASEDIILEKYDGTTEDIGAHVDMIKREDVKEFFDSNGRSDEVIQTSEGSMSGIKNIRISKNLDTLKKSITYFNKLNAVLDDKDYLFHYEEADYYDIHAQMEYELLDAAKHGRMDPAFVFGVKSILKKENGK